MVQLFEQIGLGQWLRYGTGVLELASGILLLMPSGAVAGSALATFVMLGALLVQAFMAMGNAVATVALAFVSGISLVQAQLDQPVRTRKHHGSA